MNLRKISKVSSSLLFIFLLTSCNQVNNKPKDDVKIESEASTSSKEKSSIDSNVKNENSSDISSKTSNSQPPNENPNEVVNGISLSNITIVLDPGHASNANLEKEKLSPESNVLKIKDGGGAEGVITKTPEYEICMNVALKIKEELKTKSFNVIMTKEDNSLSLGNIERAEIGNKNNANLLIRIHADSADVSSVKGASILIPEPINPNTKAIYDKSKLYGKTIIDTFCEETNAKNRGVSERSDMTGFNWSKVPVVLVELGFLSNPEEDKLLSSTDYQDKCANALSKAIEKCFFESKNK